MRTFGLSTCNAAGRIGGFLAPFATVNLVEGGRPALAELVLGSVCLVAAGAAFLLPYETRGRHLESPELHNELEQEHARHGAAGKDGSPDVAAQGEQQPLLLPGARSTAGAGSNSSGSSSGHRHRHASADCLS